MAYERPNLSQLIATAETDINGRLPGADSRLRRSVLWVLARVIGGGLFGVYGYLDWIIKQLFVTTASELFLLIHAAIWGLTQKTATQSKGSVIVTGTVGETVDAGAQLQRSDGTVFVVDIDTTLTAISQDITVTSEIYGAKTITATGSELSFISPISGINSAVIVAAGGLVGGADKEDVEALRARILARIRRPALTGKSGDYEQWALEVSGVTRAWEYPQWMGAGSVGLTFVFDGREDIIPTDDDLGVMVSYIDARRPITATIYVFPAIRDVISPTISITPFTDAVKAAAIKELRDLFARESEPGGTILRTHMDEAISVADGETDHELISPVDNVIAAPAHLPVLGDITWVAP
jgi:uncharacterized phage protein gp47/JayE